MLILKNISKTYKNKKYGNTKALENVSLTIEKNDFVAVLGKTGAGKSTLLKILSLLIRPSEGEIIYNGKNINDLKEHQIADIRKNEIGMIAQEFALIKNYTIRDNILMPLELTELSKKEKLVKLDKLIKLLELDHLNLKKPVKKLSGGEKQRVAIARALIIEPSIILADEPTGSLDEKTTVKIMEKFKELNKLGHTIVLITHDRDLTSYCNRIIEISEGKLL